MKELIDLKEPSIHSQIKMKELIDYQKIDLQTKIIAKTIADEHKGDKTPVIMVGLLNGCFAFFSDLVRNPSSITIVTLLTRESSPPPPKPSHHAFTIKDEWVIGYGLNDEKGYNRNLRSIWAL